jgi:hypothetical protein
MPVFSTRRRLVTFRLTSSEYDQLKAATTSQGARSVSEYARDAVLYKIDANTRTAVSLGEDLATLGMRLSELDNALRGLSGHIGRVLGSRPKEQQEF